MNAFVRRGACPALFDPMETGDGLLVRLPQGGGAWRLDQFAGLARAAARFGNGVVEVTSRGSVQVRGLEAASAAGFANAVVAVGIDVPDSALVLRSPLAGLDPAELIDLHRPAAEVRRRAAVDFADRLSPKVSVILDGGGPVHLDALAADVRFRAALVGGHSILHVLVAGDTATATLVGAVEPANMAAAALKLLAALAMRGPEARARDVLRQEGPMPFVGALASFATDAPELQPWQRAVPIGHHHLKDGLHSVGIGLAFGRAEAALLEDLAEFASRAGAQGISPGQDRTLLVIGLASASLAPFTESAERLGFIVRPDDPRRHVVACTGAPRCGAGEMAALAIAPAIAATARPLLDGSITIHVSGCTKGCAHPGEAALTFVGRRGRSGLVVDGSARGEARGEVAAEAIAARLAALADHAASTRRPGERTAELFARLGAETVAVQLLADAAP